MTLTPEQKAAGWIEWSGGDCPIKDDRTLFAFFNRVGGCSAGVRDASSLSWLHQGSSSWDIIAYRIIEAHGADAEPARPTPFPASYDELVFDPITGWSQTIIVDGKRPEWLRDDDVTTALPFEGKNGRWTAEDRTWSLSIAIRVRRREPKRETVAGVLICPLNRTLVTFDLIDGQPDLSTLKIAEDAL